jgi:hypothetical protein
MGRSHQQRRREMTAHDPELAEDLLRSADAIAEIPVRQSRKATEGLPSGWDLEVAALQVGGNDLCEEIGAA